MPLIGCKKPRPEIACKRPRAPCRLGAALPEQLPELLYVGETLGVLPSGTLGQVGDHLDRLPRERLVLPFLRIKVEVRRALDDFRPLFEYEFVLHDVVGHRIDCLREANDAARALPDCNLIRHEYGPIGQLPASANQWRVAAARIVSR